jgi:hypothetical protein
MATKSGGRGRYITKVGFYDIYAKDTVKAGKGGKEMVTATEYLVYHSKKVAAKGLGTKMLAVDKALELLGDKYRAIYSL